MTDPRGWPYAIDENEGESGVCGPDRIRTFKYPYNGDLDVDYNITIPVSGFGVCA